MPEKPDVRIPGQLLQIILQRIVNIEQENSEFTRLLNSPIPFSSRKFYISSDSFPPLKRLRNSAEVVYSSALPHRLSQGDPVQVEQVNHWLMKCINLYQTHFSLDSRCFPVPEILVRGFTAVITPRGDLQLKLKDAAIAHWLDTLVYGTLPIPQSCPLLHPPYEAQRLFAIQHTHARCCSLLRHAHQAEFITLSSIDPQVNSWQWLEPSPIPWLTQQQQLQILHPLNRQLVGQLLAALDLLGEQSPTAKHLFLGAEQLAQTFNRVHCACQLFDKSLQCDRDLYCVHLGLIQATQKVLFHLLTILRFSTPCQL